MFWMAFWAQNRANGTVRSYRSEQISPPWSARSYMSLLSSPYLPVRVSLSSKTGLHQSAGFGEGGLVGEFHTYQSSHHRGACPQLASHLPPNQTSTYLNTLVIVEKICSLSTTSVPDPTHPRQLLLQPQLLHTPTHNRAFPSASSTGTPPSPFPLSPCLRSAPRVRVAARWKSRRCVRRRASSRSCVCARECVPACLLG